MTAEIIISGYGGSHDETVKSACIEGARGLLIDSDVLLSQLGFAGDLELAVSVGAKMIARSISDIQSRLALANEYYSSHEIMTFMPLHTNNHELVVLYPDQIPSGMVVCGSVLEKGDECLTGYGNALEILGIDKWGNPLLPESSYVNGFLAGALYFIERMLNCSHEIARARMRSTASNKGNWTISSGYGLIDVDSAIGRPSMQYAKESWASLENVWASGGWPSMPINR